MVVRFLGRRLRVLFSRRLGHLRPFGRARAALWALRTWWQQGSRASTDRKKAAVPRAARVAPAQSCHGGCEHAKAMRNADDSPFAAAQEWARANNGNVETDIERHATHAHHRINSVLHASANTQPAIRQPTRPAHAITVRAETAQSRDACAEKDSCRAAADGRRRRRGASSSQPRRSRSDCASLLNSSHPSSSTSTQPAVRL